METPQKKKKLTINSGARIEIGSDYLSHWSHLLCGQARYWTADKAYVNTFNMWQHSTLYCALFWSSGLLHPRTPETLGNTIIPPPSPNPWMRHWLLTRFLLCTDDSNWFHSTNEADSIGCINKQCSIQITGTECLLLRSFWKYFFIQLEDFQSRDSSVGRTTRLQAGRRGKWVHFPTGAADFTVSHDVQAYSRLYQALEAVPTLVKRQGREPDHSGQVYNGGYVQPQYRRTKFNFLPQRIPQISFGIREKYAYTVDYEFVTSY
jgi:hypothetical protein